MFLFPQHYCWSMAFRNNTCECPTHIDKDERVYHFLRLRGCSLYCSMVLRWNLIGILNWNFSPYDVCGSDPYLIWYRAKPTTWIFKMNPLTIIYRYDLYGINRKGLVTLCCLILKGLLFSCYLMLILSVKGYVSTFTNHSFCGCHLS